MSHNMKSVTKNRPCPICGKPDWCGFMPADDYGELIICQRDTDKTNKIGFDGNYYVFVADSRTGHSVYEEANQRRAKDMARKGSSTNYEFSKASTPKPRTFTVVNQVTTLSNKELHLIYSSMLSFLTLESEHREYLKREGWTDELIDKNHIVSFPEKDFIRYKYRKDAPSKNPYRKKLAKLVMDKLGINSLRGVPGAFKDVNGNWTFAGRSGILFPLPDSNHLIYRVRLRMDFMDQDVEIHHENDGDKWFIGKDGSKYHIDMSGVYRIEDKERKYDKSTGKYRNFASFKMEDEAYEKGFIVNQYDSGCESGNKLGFYYNEQRDDMFMAYLIEGEKKAMYCNDIRRAIFVSTPGVNSWALLLEGKIGERPIDILKAKGVRIIIVAFDADKSKNNAVLEAERNAVEAIRKEGVIIGLAEWNIKNGKGMDDLLYHGYKETYVVA